VRLRGVRKDGEGEHEGGIGWKRVVKRKGDDGEEATVAYRGRLCPRRGGGVRGRKG
jgi:hypothetical protein